MISYYKRFYDTIKVIENKLFFNQPTFKNRVPFFFRTICAIWVIWFSFVQVNDTDLQSKLKNEYRKRDQELMIEQLRNDPKIIPKPSRDEITRMLYESHVSLEDYAKEFKSLWVTNALDGSGDYLVSERVYKLVRTRMIDFRNELMKTASPKNLKQLLKW